MPIADENINQPNRIILADDHKLFMDGLEQIINSMPGFEVIGKAANGKQLMQQLSTLSPDIILLDIEMPLMDGMATAQLVREKRPDVKIILISMHYEPDYKEFVHDNRVDGFLMKDTDAHELKEVLLKVMAGNKVFVLPGETAKLQEAASGTGLMKLYKLTKTEIEIIRSIAEGDSTKMIAQKRNLSYLTVESHRKNIFRKLNLKNMAEVAVFAVKNGIHKK